MPAPPLGEVHPPNALPVSDITPLEDIVPLIVPYILSDPGHVAATPPVKVPLPPIDTAVLGRKPSGIVPMLVPAAAVTDTITKFACLFTVPIENPLAFNTAPVLIFKASLTARLT